MHFLGRRKLALYTGTRPDDKAARVPQFAQAFPLTSELVQGVDANGAAIASGALSSAQLPKTAKQSRRRGRQESARIERPGRNSGSRSWMVQRNKKARLPSGDFFDAAADVLCGWLPRCKG